MIDDRDLYSEVYYDSNETVYFNDTVIRNFGNPETFLRGGLVLLLRAGFILIQIGCIPISDVHMILLHNIVDIACGTATYGIVGYILSFGHDAGGLVGRESWIISEDADMNNAVLGWAAVITATAIFTTMVAGRMHCLGYVIITILFAMIVQPVLMHWIWSNSGWMHKSAMSNHKVSYKDQAGGCLIHVTGGVLALIGGLALGRRILRLRDIDESSLPPDSPGNVVAGYVLLIIGLMGFCLPTPTYERTHFPTDYIGLTFINNMMAVSGGIITVISLQFILAHDTFDYWVIIRCMQGAIAGVVTVAAGIDVYKPLVAFGLSIAGTLIFFIVAKQTFSSSLEDYANIIPVHLICGLFGTFLPPLCGSSENLGTSHNVVINFGWQVMCSFTILGVMVLFALPLFCIFHCCGFLRNRSDERDHRRALTALAGQSQRCFLQRIFTVDEGYQQYLQPGYRTKHEANFIEEIHERQSEITNSQVTTQPSSLATRTESSSAVKTHAKTHQPLTAIVRESQGLLAALKLHEDKIINPERDTENKNIQESDPISEHMTTSVLGDTKRKRQLFTVHSAGNEDSHRTEHKINMEGESSELTKTADTFTNLHTYSGDDKDEDTEVVHIHYRKYRTAMPYGQDLPTEGALSFLSHISNILERQHNVGKGDCAVHTGKEINVSNFLQRSTSAPHLTNVMLQNWENSLKKPRSPQPGESEQS